MWTTDTPAQKFRKKLCTCKADIVDTMQQQKLDVSSDIKTISLKKGLSIARYNNQIMLFKWQEKRDVLLLSTQFIALI